MAVRFALCIAFWAAALPTVAADESNALLDECVAGTNANLALIEHGHASYRMKSKWRYSPKPSESKVKVIFDDRRLRTELTYTQRVGGRIRTVTDHTILDPDQRIEYRPPLSGLRVPSANIVVIVPNEKRRYAEMHPRQQQHGPWFEPPTFTWKIGSMRRLAAPGQLTARRDGDGSIVISFQPPLPKERAMYWISPEQGYGLVRANEWMEDYAGKEPSSEYEAKLRDAGNGAFVVSYRRERDCSAANGALSLVREEEIWLESIDLASQPAEEAFTLDGLNLPIGSPVHDRLHGREYLYGIEGVEEGAIDVGQPTGPMRIRFWLHYFNLTVAGGLLVWVGNRLGRRFDRR